MGGKITNIIRSTRLIPATTTRDRLNNALADLELRQIRELLKKRNVSTSIGTLQSLRAGTVGYVKPALAAAIRILADTYVPPSGEAVAYMTTEEAMDFIEACRNGPQGRR